MKKNRIVVTIEDDGKKCNVSLEGYGQHNAGSYSGIIAALLMIVIKENLNDEFAQWVCSKVPALRGDDAKGGLCLTN